MDDEVPALPRSAAGRLVKELLEVPEIRVVFERKGRAAELYREQPVEAIRGEQWLSGVIDRLHVIRGDDGKATALELIDFKTDAVESPEQLAERYAAQMAAYRDVLSKAYGDVPVRCLLLSTKLKEWVEVM